MQQKKNILFIAAALAVAVVTCALVLRLNQPPAVVPAPDPVKPPALSEKRNPSSPSGNGFSPYPDQPDPPSGAIRRDFFGQAPLPLNLDGPAFERRTDGRILKKDVANQLADLNDSNHDPIEDIQILNSAVTSYRKIFRENPIAGENREVVEALTGNNPYQLMLIDPSHPAINSKNELVDRWRVPYRFHPISRDYMEIQSAGNDRQFGTSDDVMVEEPITFEDPTNFEEDND